MFWFALALLGALSQAAYSFAVKVLLRTVQPYPLAGFSFLSGSLILSAISLISGIPATGPGFFPAVAVTVIINIVATILFYRALTTTDLSLAVPMLAFTPVFLILTSFLILGELPSPAGAAGILLVAAGGYLLNLSYRGGWPESLSAPFLRLRHDRGIQAMLLVAFLYSISVNYDKQVVEESDPVFGSAIVLLLLATAFLSLAALTGKSRGVGGSIPGVGALPGILQNKAPFWLLIFTVIGLVLAIEVIAINTAYTMAIVPYVITVKRLAIFFSVLAGGLLLGERQLGGRIIGAAVMIAGAAVIAFGG